MHGLTHVPHGSDPIPGLPDASGGPGIEDIILSKAAVGLWKLDETSGTTAVDSSGAGNNMTVPGSFSYTAPTWGQTAGPPATLAALFTTGSGVTDGARLAVTMPAGMTDDFSAGCWVRVNDTGVGGELMGQGVPIHASGGGWMLWYDVSTDKFALTVGATGYPQLEANNPSAIDGWYLFGISRIAGTWTLYLDGLSQTATSTATPTAATATWIGDCGWSAANHGSRQTISWAFITDTPLTGADWATLHDTGLSGGALAAGLVWTSNGAGGASWETPTGGTTMFYEQTAAPTGAALGAVWVDTDG